MEQHHGEYYTQLYVHIIFAVKGRESLIPKQHKEAVHQYITRIITASSSKWINQKRWVVGRFEWQTGFGAFSYAHSQLDAIVHYIKNQEVHHSRRSFRAEYLEFLKRFNVPYNPKYVFDWVVDSEE